MWQKVLKCYVCIYSICKYIFILKDTRIEQKLKESIKLEKVQESVEELIVGECLNFFFWYIKLWVVTKEGVRNESGWPDN